MAGYAYEIEMDGEWSNLLSEKVSADSVAFLALSLLFFQTTGYSHKGKNIASKAITVPIREPS